MTIGAGKATVARRIPVAASPCKPSISPAPQFEGNTIMTNQEVYRENLLRATQSAVMLVEEITTAYQHSGPLAELALRPLQRDAINLRDTLTAILKASK